MILYRDKNRMQNPQLHNVDHIIIYYGCNKHTNSEIKVSDFKKKHLPTLNI